MVPWTVPETVSESSSPPPPPPPPPPPAPPHADSASASRWSARSPAQSPRPSRPSSPLLQPREGLEALNCCPHIWSNKSSSESLPRAKRFLLGWVLIVKAGLPSSSFRVFAVTRRFRCAVLNMSSSSDSDISSLLATTLRFVTPARDSAVTLIAPITMVFITTPLTGLPACSTVVNCLRDGLSPFSRLYTAIGHK